MAIDDCTEVACKSFLGNLRVQRCKSCRVSQILEDCFEHYSLGLDSDC